MGLSKINHLSHQHPLILKDPQEPYQCDGCKQVGFGLCYECNEPGCNFCLHDECANATQSAFNPFLKDCSLTFHVKPPQQGKQSERLCDACGQDILGFVYQCDDRKDPHDLHPCCLKLQRESTNNGVTVKLKKKLPSECLKCGSKKITKRIKGWCYASSCGNYCYHVACMKEMMVESWKMKQGKKTTTSRMDLQCASTSQALAKPSGGSGKGRKLWNIAKAVIMVIVSAIFGNPTALIITLAEQLFST